MKSEEEGSVVVVKLEDGEDFFHSLRDAARVVNEIAILKLSSIKLRRLKSARTGLLELGVGK
jgi:predicted DNA-binding protein with PD1-like motif